MPRLRSLAWKLLGLPSRLAYRRTLAQTPMRAPAGPPALSYGGVLRTQPGQIVAGGRVKLLHLARKFPEQAYFNVLYMVSSAMPPHARELVQWAKAGGAKLVWNQNGVAFPAWAGNRGAETNAPMAELLHLADAVVYQSKFCRLSADRYLGPARVPSTVLLNPVELSEFSPIQPGPGLDTWEMLTAGTHYQSWRVLGPIETLRHLRDRGHPARLTVAGAFRWPNAQTQVREAMERLGVAQWVSLRPAFTQEEAVAMYRSAHVLLHPKYHDPCPTVVIEALACGLPVIGSRSGGLPELIGDDGGELIPVPLSWEMPAAPSPEAMAQAVVRIMQEWPQRSRAARVRAETLFAAEHWVDAHRQIFENLL